MNLRLALPDDAEALAGIYRGAVLGLGPAAYTPQQVAVWSSFAEDLPAFAAFVGGGYTILAEIDGAPAAFCQLHPEDHVSLLYTAASCARRGLATAVYRNVEAHARERGQRVLTTDASKLSRPFFEREGFRVRRTEQTCRQGVYFERYQMEKVLVP